MDDWNLDDHSNQIKFDSGRDLLRRFRQLAPFVVNNAEDMEECASDPDLRDRFVRRRRAQRTVLRHRKRLLAEAWDLERQLRASGYEELADRLVNLIEKSVERY